MCRASLAEAEGRAFRRGQGGGGRHPIGQERSRPPLRGSGLQKLGLRETGIDYSRCVFAGFGVIGAKALRGLSAHVATRAPAGSSGGAMRGDAPINVDRGERIPDCVGRLGHLGNPAGRVRSALDDLHLCSPPPKG